MPCQKGQIVKSGYKQERKSGSVKVGAHCIKDMGKKGKGPALGIQMKKNDLKRYGYYLKDSSAGSRRLALKKAINKRKDPARRKKKAMGVYKKLILLATLHKRTKNEKDKRKRAPYAKRAKADAAWVKAKYLM